MKKNNEKQKRIAQKTYKVHVNIPYAEYMHQYNLYTFELKCTAFLQIFKCLKGFILCNVNVK